MVDHGTLGDVDARTFYHGTSLEAAEAIFREGFRVWFADDFGRHASGGNLGTGVYVTREWRIALWFGPALLRVSLVPGTRLLDASPRPDRKMLAYLQREFGREILTKAPWKALPENKRLELRELVALFRYHYWHAWEGGRSESGEWSWARSRRVHSRLLPRFRSVLTRYGFDGYGNPEDDNGIVVFAPDRLLLEELVAHFSPPEHTDLLTGGFPSLRDLRDVRTFFSRRGSSRAKALAEEIGTRGGGSIS